MEVYRSEFCENTLKAEITDSGIAVLDETWNCENVCDPFSRLYYVTKGKGFLKSEESTVEMTAGNVYLVPAFFTFSYGCEEMEKLYFHVSITKTDKYDLLSGINKVLQLPYGKEKTKSLIKLYNAKDYLSFLTLKNAVFNTITDFSKIYTFPKTEVKDYSETVKKTIRYIHKNAKINLSVKEISKNLFISESTIRKYFKAEVGVTVGEYIDDIVFFKAKELLKSKNILIGEISERLGFCDQFYFSRRFKERYEKTPTVYRREIMV